MASKTMWKVDPETKSKLLEIQKTNSNDRCCDCGAPSPQWASPKFGIFMCLNCAGIHRGLGVHISFVRSISMDSFKSVEIERMRLGGNKPWREFYKEAESNRIDCITWDDATISERYSGEVGEEWRERLSAKVEGRKYDPNTIKRIASKTASKSSHSNPSTRSQTPTRFQKPRRSNHDFKSGVDNKCFSDLNVVNTSCRSKLPSSREEKQSELRSQTLEIQKKEFKLPRFDDLQKDPVAALSRSLNWFSTAVSKTVRTFNEGYIQPSTKSTARPATAAYARLSATQVTIGAQNSVKNNTTHFTQFSQGNNSKNSGSREIQYQRLSPNFDCKKDYFHNFGNISTISSTKDTTFNISSGMSNSVGTNAIKKASGGSYYVGPSMVMKKDENIWQKS